MRTIKEKKDIPADKIAQYDKLIKTNAKIERKGVSLPFTSYNGHMFTFLSQSGTLGIRLPENERTNFLNKYKTTLIEAHGVIMKEYVAVPENLLSNVSELKKYLQISFEYVISLTPKSKRKRNPKKNK